MKKLIALATLLIATSTAQAGDSFSFQIGGQSVYIDAPRNCTSASCVSVSIPGVFEHNARRKRKPDTADTSDTEASLPPQPAPQAQMAPRPQTPAVAAPPAAPQAPAQATSSLEPANGRASSAPLPASSSPAPAPAEAAAPAVATPVPSRDPAPSARPAVMAAAPVAPAVQQQQTQPARPVISENSPIGTWMTEKKEGKVRIETCGSNLCGYSINARTNANGEKVLINMKPGSNKWTGRIFDPNSGSTYDSTIALKGPDTLRVQGCAFGGMFCGGQTWSRVD